MSQQFQADAVAQNAGVVLVTTTEAVALTSNPLSLPAPNAKLAIAGLVTVTPGTNTTGLRVRIRRGTTITDPLVGSALLITAGVAAGVGISIPMGFVDPVAGLVQAQYSLTVEQVGASANGSVGAAYLKTEVLSG